MMEADGYKLEGTGFPGTLEKWVADDHRYAVMFVLRPDPKLRDYWKRSWPDVYPLSLKSRPDIRIMWIKEDRTLIVKLF